MIEAGLPGPLGANWDGEGVNFALYSSSAEAVDLCLFDGESRSSGRIAVTNRTGDVWHAYVPGCGPGQAYGYRVHGAYAPDDGLRHNANKLLIDPYARELRGELVWSPAVFDFELDAASGDMLFNDADSAEFVPKSVVAAAAPERAHNGPHIPWSDLIIYEANVRGYTMRHPAVPESERGRFRGLSNGRILEYLKSLGITAIELMPVQAFIDEQFLQRRGLRNFWGYNTINFFAPAQRYLGGDDTRAFREMVDAIHDAGIEVILDVVYNHTGESDRHGPTLSFRGIDNLSYYRTMPGMPGEYVNYTGCGNTINSGHPVVRELVVDSLRYWVEVMGVDGYRFDLATVLGRGEAGFDRLHPLFKAIEDDAILKNVKLIAEPWDLESGGYQLANFPPAWAEWNDHYRDTVRRFWRGDSGQAANIVQRIDGSQDIFESDRPNPPASVNYVTSHDGFTLADVVSYETRHNEANGENNNDGHEHNYSCNYGTEGATDDPGIRSARRCQRLNMLATLLLSRGTPMLLAGDEFGNSQLGNNNAYAQDNEIGWLDWSGAEADPNFLETVRDLIRLRRDTVPVHRPEQVIDWSCHGDKHGTIVWRSVDEAGTGEVIAILVNASHETVELELPDDFSAVTWQLAFSTGPDAVEYLAAGIGQISGHSIACLRQATGV